MTLVLSDVEFLMHENDLCALAKISCGVSHLVHTLKENTRNYSKDVQFTDIIGSLGYALKVFNELGSMDFVNVVELDSY